MFDNKTLGGNLTLKFEIKKSFYDTIDQQIPLKVLLTFDFGSKFYN